MIQENNTSSTFVITERETAQYLMPAVLDNIDEKENGFQIYPHFPMGRNRIFRGIDSLVDYIIQHNTVCIDGFSGVNWELLIGRILHRLHSRNITVNAVNMAGGMKDEEEINTMVAPFLGEEDSVWGKKCNLAMEDFFVAERIRAFRPDPDCRINIIYGHGASLAGWDGPLIYFDLPKNELQYRMRAGSVSNLGISGLKADFKMYKHYYFIDWVVMNREKERLAESIAIIADAQHEESITWSRMKDIRNALAEMSHSFFRVRPWFEPGAWGGDWIKKHISGLNKEVINYAWAFSLIVPENGLLFESDGNLLEISFDFLMNQESKNILGRHQAVFGTEFPIRFNFLDTYKGGNLSIQCHPSREYIREVFGENITQDESYYILDCREDANVYLGFQENIDPDAFKKDLLDSQKNNIELNMEDYVQKHLSSKHQLYLIPNGTVHSAGAGNMVLEISATPYIFTFKMYDWLRLDLNGKPRPINIDHAFNNLRFDRKGKNVVRELFSATRVTASGDGYEVIHYPTHKDHFYDVRRLDFDRSIERNTDDSCQVMMLVEGEEIRLETADGHTQTLAYAETFVVPAAAGKFTLTNTGAGRAKVINAFLK